MNQRISSSRECLPEVLEGESTTFLLAVENLLKAMNTDVKQASEFSQLFQVVQLNLGEDLYSYKIANSSNDSVYNEQNLDNFYLVCEGRVRLLGYDPQRQREVSVQLLEVGATFGADPLFCQVGLPYRAIAASTVQIARLPSEQLKLWLKRLPELQDFLQQQTQQRQRQMFFKTSTELQRLPSHQLQELLTYVRECPIPAGESLAQATPADRGRYWLRSGKINSGMEEATIAANGQSPHSGFHLQTAPSVSWGHPDATPEHWRAQTDLWVYHLPIEHWQDASAIAPKYFTPSGDRADNNGHQTPRSKTSKVPLKSQHSVTLKPNLNPETPHKKTVAIAFPKPIRRIQWPWQEYPLILQQSSSDCGVACLATISQYWGKRFSINFLRELADVGRAGASLKNLAAAAEQLGFLARPVRASLDKIAEQHHPWIAHWQGIHYVVVYRCRKNRILIADPAVGKRSISRQEFLANWTGFALLLDPTERFKQTPSQKLSLSRFASALLPYRSLIVQILLISLLVQICGVVTPLFTQIILDQVVVNKSFATLNAFVLGLLLFNIWNIGLGATRQYLLYYFSNRLNLTLIGGFINHALMLPLKFFESRRVGDIITRVQENQKIQRFLIGQVVLAWLDMLMGIVYLGLMLYYNLRLTLLVLGLIPPIIILTLIATPLLRRVSREIFNEAAEQNSLLVEILTGIATVKAAAAEREVRWRWEDRFTSTLNAGFRGQNLGNALQVIGGSINSLGSTALLWYGATLVIQDELTIGQFVAFNMMIGRVISPVLALVSMWNQLQEVLISVERLNDVFETEPEEIPGNPTLTLPRLRGEVKFDNVTFSYNTEQERNTLQNISFEAYPGQTIAIVGRSGSGKSTLVKLLQGLYLPNNGRVLVDGYDIRHVSLPSLRIQLGVVPQECFLFSGTILDNITLYRPDFTLEQVTEVAKLAEAHAFIQDMPLGYSTKVGERGSTLSGGQRQRIAIARALLGNPRILVLDEATSSLDTESERRFQQNLERLCRDRTTFIIAHRLSTVRNADSILVLDRGILVEQGTHDALMALQGLYYHLAQQQLNL